MNYIFVCLLFILSWSHSFAGETTPCLSLVKMLSYYVGENLPTHPFPKGQYSDGVIYLRTAEERLPFQITFRDGLATWTSGEKRLENGRYIFVRSEHAELLAKFDSKGDDTAIFHHSSFLAGEDVAFAGDMTLNKGKVKLLRNWSGHYRTLPTKAMDLYQEWKATGVSFDQNGYLNLMMLQSFSINVPFALLDMNWQYLRQNTNLIEIFAKNISSGLWSLALKDEVLFSKIFSLLEEGAEEVPELKKILESSYDEIRKKVTLPCEELRPNKICISFLKLSEHQ